MRRSAVWALFGAGAVAAVGALAILVALQIDDAGNASTTTVTAGAPTIATTTTPAAPAPAARISLVTSDDSGPVVRHDAVTITAEELAVVDAAGVAGAAGVVSFDPQFVQAQEDRGVLLDRLRAQVEYVTERLRAAVADPARADVAMVGPPIEGGPRVEAPVVILNSADRPRRVRHVDLAVVTGEEVLLTRTTRFLSGAGVEIAAGGAWFTFFVFDTDQVVPGVAAVPPYAVEAEVVWDE